MAINVFPVNAVAGEPEYSGRELRQMFSALIAGASADRPLGAASGVRVGTPDTTVTATATTWTVKPHSGILDLQAAVEAGPYLYAIDADVEGALDPAHATNPRIDIITVRLDDPAESDGSSVPDVTVVYKPGTAAASPTVPTPDTTREMILARISVPESGGGSPSVTWVAPRAVASGGIVPVRNSSERDALAALVQPTADNPLYVHNQSKPAGMELERTIDGITWVTFDARDTGWISGTSWLASGVGESSSTPIQLRAKGDWVVMRGAFTGISIPASGSQDLATLPPEYRPTQTIYFPMLSAGGTSSLGWVTINTLGTLSATNGMPSGNMTVVRTDAVNYYR